MQIAKNDVLSFYIVTQENTKAHGFHALGAGGREFESRHSDHKKSHDEALEIAFISWLYLLYIGLKMAGKCDRSATNSGKPVLCDSVRPCSVCLAYIIRLYNGLLYAHASGVSQITIPI